MQAGSVSWKAFFFGSFDASNRITVDKPPASLWVMELSARIFGVSSWSVLAPQALEGVASVGLLYATVRRWFSPAAALIAGAAVMAIGGFNGTDQHPTLAEFQSAVASGEVHYFIADGGGAGGGPGAGTGSSTSGAITQWVESRFTATTLDGVTVYDLTSSAS